MKHKNKRQTAILTVIKESDIETQTDLAIKLQMKGINATQATISRDIKQLHLIKVLNKETNKYRYEQRAEISREVDSPAKSRAMTMIRENVISLRSAQNLVVVKCYPGSAQAVGAAIDSYSHDEIIGTIAGDDTIFIATEDNYGASALVDRLSEAVSDN